MTRLWCAALLVLAAPASAQTIPGIPGLAPVGGDGKEPAVRLADDPRSKVERLKKAVKEARETIVLRSQDAQRWEKRRAAIRARRAALVGLREALVSDTEPTAESREWSDDAHLEAPEPDAAPPDAAPPDAGVADASASDAGVGDAETPGTGADGGVLPPPEPAPELRTGPELLPVLKVGDLYLRARVHPAQIAELDRLAAELDGVDGLLSSLLRLYAEERGLLAEAMAEADKLLKEMDARAGKEKEKRRFFGLRDVEKLALSAHLANIELSLARARSRQVAAESGDPTEAADTGELEPVMASDGGGATPAAAFASSHREAEQLRDELERTHRDSAPMLRSMQEVREDVTRARTLRFQLALISAERDLQEKEDELQLGLERLAITPDEIRWSEQKLARSVDLRGKAIPRIEARRDALRASLSLPGTGPFSVAAAAEVEDVLLAERLVFERLKLQRDAFRNDIIHVLADALEGVAPKSEFLERYRPILDTAAHHGRTEDLNTRCDGWRRAGTELKRASVPPEMSARHGRMLDSFAALQDTCMREEWVLATQGRLADVGRYHFDKLKWESRGARWYSWRVLLSIIFVILAFVISQVIGRLTHRLAGHAHEGPEGAPAGWPSLEPPTLWAQRRLRLRRGLALVLYLGLAGLVWLYAAVWCINHVWDYPMEVGRLLGWATYPIFYISDRGVSVWSMAQIGVWGVCAVWAGRLLQRWISDNLLMHFSVERGVRDAVGTMVRYVVILLGLGTGLASVGIGVGALAVVFGVIGIGIGFGLRDIANNFISGFIILLERPIRKGDFIQVNEMVGQVREISARATTIETRDAISVIVPNSEFITGHVVNLTLGSNEQVRTQIAVGVAYGTEVAMVEEVLLEVARRNGWVLASPEPKVHMLGFEDSALKFVLHVWTERIRMLPELVSELNKAVDAAFREAGIEIPFPQRTVHMVERRDDKPREDE